jgi:hypothetical protein
MEPNGVTQLDAKTLYEALEEIEIIINPPKIHFTL